MKISAIFAATIAVHVRPDACSHSNFAALRAAASFSLVRNLERPLVLRRRDPDPVGDE